MVDGYKIRELRKKAKITQEQLAEKLGLSRSVVVEIENNTWAGLPEKFRMAHGLRHVYISYLIEQGVPVSVVQRLSGHKDYRAMKRYIHLGDEVLRKASDTAKKMGDTE